MIKRFYILLLAIVASVGMMNAKVTWNRSNISDLEVYTYHSYSKEGVTLSANADMIDARWFDYGDESQSGIEFHANATGGFTFSNTLGKNFTKIEMTLRGPAGWDHANLGSGWSFSWEDNGEEPVFVVTWTGNAKTVDLAKDESSFHGDYVKRIVFYFEGDSEAPDPTYTVALEDGTANADKVTLSATSAVEGATVTVTPNDEYEIKDFSAYYVVVNGQVGSINTIDATLNPETGAYSFKMPAYDVTIEATIAAKPVPEGDIFAGFTATAGSGGFTNEGHANLVDGKFTSAEWTKWCTNNDHRSVPTGESGDACWWIDFEASAALDLTGYILTTGNDTGNEHGRNPKNWLLKAKLNADDAWTTIATVTNDVTMKNQSFKDYKFFVDQSGSYKYFRFEVFANQGANVMQLCELRLIGTEASAPTPAGPIPCTAADLGKVLCTDGSIYATVSEATAAGKTAAAVIAYVDTQNGKALALALADDSDEMMDWATAKTTAAAHTPAVSNGIWALASKDDWNNMITAAGSYTALRDCFSSVGGTNMRSAWYWSSTSFSFYAWCYQFNNGEWFDDYQDANNSVRACLAFDIPAAPAYETVMNLINAIGTVELTAECKAKIDAARTAYNALSDEDKAQVTNLTTLTDAEAAYAGLLAEKVAPVIAAIDAVPATPLTDATKKLSEYNKVTDARALYDALTDEEKAAVTNYGKLEAAEEAFAAIGGGTGLNVSTEDIGKVLCADGSLYATKDEATAASKTPVAMIAYVEDSKGLAIALEDESNTMIWSTAITTAAAHTPAVTGGTWKLPSLLEWQQMFVGCGADLTPSETSGNVTDYLGLRDKLLAAGGNGFVEWSYWTTTEWADNPAEAWDPYFSFSPEIVKWYKNKKDRDDFYIRAILAFNVVASNALAQAQAAKDLIDAIPAEITLDAACVKAIEDARAAYDALGENASLLDDADLQKLTDAEATLTALNQAVADEVVAKINNIPTPVELKLATRDSINNARAAYDALNDDQKALVPTAEYQKLLDAEAALAELNKGGSASVDIVWNGNTGIANVSPTTTSPAYEGMTVTVGKGSSFSTYQSRLYFTFNSQPNGGFIFANENGTNITKVVIESTTALTSTMTEVDRMGSGWVISNENKTATWTGNADSVKIWEGQHFANYWVVDSIVFTVSGTATPLDSAQAVKDLIDAIPTPVEYPTSGPAIAAALNAYDALSDAAKGALDAADVQKLNDAATQYAAQEAIAAIEAIPAEIVYDPAVKAAIETARDKYDALSDASKALVDDEVVAKLTNAEQAWADLVAKVEHNVSYIGKDGELKNEKVALLHIPEPAPDFNGYEFVRWDVKAGDFLEEGLRIKAVYTPIITTNPAAYDTLVYNGTAQTLITAGIAKEGHIEYRLNDGEWSTELPQAMNAGTYVVTYKLVRDGHDDYISPNQISVTIAKTQVAFDAPTAVESLVYNASNQTLIAAGQTNDGIFEYTLAPNDEDSWNTALPQAKDAGTYSVYYRVQGDLNHLDSTAVDPIAVTIAKAELTATADNKAIIFGELAPQFTVTYAGWQGDDEASVLTGEIAYATPYVRGNNVGEYTITPSGVDAANYTITFVNGTLTVNRKSAESSDIMAAQEDDEQLVYTNAVNKPTIFVKDTTLTLTEEKDYTLTFVGRGETEYTESATAPTHVGEYTAKIEFIGNYKDMLTVDFTISKAELTITADDKENIFGEEAPEFTVSYEGFLGTDTKDVLTGSQAYACEYKRGDNIGDYTIIPSGVDAHDYVITFVNGTLTVNRKSAKDADIVAAQLAGEALVYNAEVNRPTIVVTDTTLTLTEDKDYVLTFIGTANDASVYEESAVAPTKAGDYTAIVAFVGNYIDTLTVDFTVSKAPLTITADDKEMIYGDEHPEFTVSYDGFLGTDDNSVLLGTQGYSCSYAPGSYIGTYAITPKDVEADNYAITFVDGTLTVSKAAVYVSGAEVHIAKFEDNNTDAEVTDKGVLHGVKLNDPVDHITTASFSSADVAEHLTITLFYELSGDPALIENYYLTVPSEVYTEEGVIIEQMLPDNDHQPGETEQVEVKEGIDVYLFGYCDGSGNSLRYHLNRGIPDQYMIDFEDSRFTDVDWTNLDTPGKDGTIFLEIPEDMPTGDYNMSVQFRDSRFDWLESRQFNVTFHVNLPETYTMPQFGNVIALVDTCECFTDIQWYYRATDTDVWEPIPGATGYYCHVDNKLTGEYFVKAKMNGVETFTCPQTDMETLYQDDIKQAKVSAYPNPVVNTTTVTIENSENRNHSLRIVNMMGIEVENATFEGDETTVDMGGYTTGNYMISVDGIVVKVMKK